MKALFGKQGVYHVVARLYGGVVNFYRLGKFGKVHPALSSRRRDEVLYVVALYAYKLHILFELQKVRVLVFVEFHNYGELVFGLLYLENIKVYHHKEHAADYLHTF